MSELRDVREYVNEALEKRGIEAWVFEAHASAREESTLGTSLAEVENADVYVGLFWQLPGPVTFEEYRRARAGGKPCFVYVRDKSLLRDQELEEFLRNEVYDLRHGVTYAYFDSALEVGQRIADDVMGWLVRRHREMTAEIREARVSREEIGRLQAQVEHLQAVSREPLPQGGAADYLAQQMRGWFEAIGYRFERHEARREGFFEWIIEIPARRGFERVVVHGKDGEAGSADIAALRRGVTEHQADEGWLVVARRISPAAREAVAQGTGTLFCYTFDELLDEHANFEEYFAWLEMEVKRRGIDKMYIPLACSKDELDPVTGRKVGENRYDERSGWIEGYIDLWLDDPSKEHLSVLGEFGTGKTWFALHYAWIALQRYREARERGVERPRLPIVIALRDYAKAVSIESLFSEFFFRKHEIRLPGYSAFERLNRMGKLLLIFDGFDEMAARIDRQEMINNFWRLAQVVVPGAKAILTCRTEHFPESREGRALLSAELQASTAMLTGEPPQFEVLELQKLSDSQIRQALSFRTDAETTEKVLANPLLLDLARRPVMTEFILEALPDIEAGKPTDLSRVYLYAVRRKMERDIREERTFTSLADKLYFLCELSWEMLSTDRMSLNYRQFPDRLRRLFGSKVQEQKDLDHWHYDMMGQTMLIRNADGDYSPAHRSLLEFFVAYKFAAQMGALAGDFTELARSQSEIDRGAEPRDSTWSAYFQRRPELPGGGNPSPPLRDFNREAFVELGSTVGRQRLPLAIRTLMNSMVVPERLRALIAATTGQNPEALGYIGGNAATLIHDLSGDFRDALLPGASLRGAELGDCSLAGADFRGADLREVMLERANLDRCDLSGSDLSGATLMHCWRRGARFEGARTRDDTILVFIGEWVGTLPLGSTVLDAAFWIHSELGLQAVQGIVNDQPAPLDRPLGWGEKVFIERDSSRYTVRAEWIAFVRTWWARLYIKRYFRRLSFAANEVLTRDLLEVLGQEKLSRLASWQIYDVLKSLFIPELDEDMSFFRDLVDGRVSPRAINSQIAAAFEKYRELRWVLFEEMGRRPKGYTWLCNRFSMHGFPALFGVKTGSEVMKKVLCGEIKPREIARIISQNRSG
jgi:hypothetical protein